jgi:4-coumarate--CoA ligase
MTWLSRYSAFRCGFVMSPNPYESLDSGSVGELRASIQGKVVDEAGRALPRNEVGEILVRTPFCMTRYLNNATATQNAFTGDGWYETGDLGYVNDRDQWFILDRKKVPIPYTRCTTC